MRTLFLLILLTGFSITGCKSEVVEEEGTRYKVSRLSQAPEINAVWDKEPWTGIKSLQLSHYMGEEPEHFPFTEAKIAYDNLAIYVIFRVEDRYVKAVHSNHQDPVYTDSCVEFFFSPDDNSDEGYFNLEMNCGGTALFHFQKIPRKDPVSITRKDFEKVRIAHTLPEIVDPEIKDPVTWYVEYRIPFEILNNYTDIINPERGVRWQANFYKCADKCSHPHWLTWSVIDRPQPDFHRPEYFGILEFQ